MSLYELESMMRALSKGKKSEGRAMTDAEFDTALENVRAMNLPDVVV